MVHLIIIVNSPGGPMCTHCNHCTVKFITPNVYNSSPTLFQWKSIPKTHNFNFICNDHFSAICNWPTATSIFKQIPNFFHRVFSTDLSNASFPSSSKLRPTDTQNQALVGGYLCRDIQTRQQNRNSLPDTSLITIIRHARVLQALCSHKIKEAHTGFSQT